MQVTATEIILPLNRERPFSKRAMLSPSFMCLFLLGYGIFLLIPQKGQGLTPGAVLFPIALIVLSTVVLIGIALALLGVGVRTRHIIRIDHEGVFFSRFFPTVVTWSEISFLVPYTWTFLGLHPVALGIIPQDPEAIIARVIENKSRNILSLFFTKIDMYFYRRSNARTLLNIHREMLPISIDELIGMIEERFADELREYNIPVLGWQN